MNPGDHWASHKPGNICPPQNTCRQTPRQTRSDLRAGSPGKKKTCPAGASNAETRAPFRATRTHYCAATAGFHAHPESMCTLATGGGRLIGPFHDLCLNWYEKPAITTVNVCFCQSDSAPAHSAQECLRLWITLTKKAKIGHWPLHFPARL